MPLFEQAIPIEVDTVVQVVAEHWQLTLGDRIKASQNHTYAAKHITTEEKYIVRITPDPEGRHMSRVEREVLFVDYLAKHADRLHHVCAPVRTSTTNELTHKHDNLIIVVYAWALGAPLNFLDNRWMTDPCIAHTWGQWLAQFHALSKQFSIDHPEIASSIQRWDDIHEGILKGAPVDPVDTIAETDSEVFGVLHGDLNISNFYFIDSSSDSAAGLATLSVFDWDQVQRGWYLWDLAQASFAVHMLHGAGSVVDDSPVPEADPATFESHLFAGYESVAGEGSVDRARFQRMINLRKYFYETFCRRALAEGDLPADMAHFVKYIVRWFDKVQQAT